MKRFYFQLNFNVKMQQKSKGFMQFIVTVIILKVRSGKDSVKFVKND